MTSTKGTALVTGASRGIGRATAVELARRGYSVIATMRDPAAGADLPGLSDGAIVVANLDVTDPGSWQLPDDLTVLVNNAGTEGDSAPVENADLATWRSIFEVNYFGLVAVTQAALPALKRNAPSVIANVTSSAVLAAVPFFGAYRASKAAASSITETMRLELAQFDIRVIEVLPGPIDTDMFHSGSGSKPELQTPEYRALAERADEQRSQGSDKLLDTPENAARAIADAIATDGGPMRYGCDPVSNGLLQLWRENTDEQLYEIISAPIANV